MHNTLRIRDYIFDTNALRDAFEMINLQEAPDEAGYSGDALYSLFDYFCDWGPVREGRISTPCHLPAVITHSVAECCANLLIQARFLRHYLFYRPVNLSGFTSFCKQ